MEEEKTVNWTAVSLEHLADIYDFIENNAGPAFASEYIDQILEFGENLKSKAEHYPFCRNIKFQQKQYRCALFKGAYIVVYNLIGSGVFILGVIHSKRGPKAFENI